ncbi:MAG: DNA replication/repair protein RecF, partial [Actinomycetota bacterium]
MRVLGLRLVNFRSYCDTAVEFGPGTTVVVGANATGKTNLLEGAFFGLRGSSPRTRSDDKLITWGEPFTRVTVALEDDQGERHTCEVAYAPRQGRRVRYDGVEVAGLDELRRRSMVFIFVPESLLLVKGSPARRRAHLDVFAAAIDPAYAAALAQLTQALRQRNAQLVAVREGADPAALAPWDGQFAAAAAELAP